MRSSASSSKPPAKSGAERVRSAAAKVGKSHLGVMLASLAAGSAATVTVLDSWDKVLVDLGFKKSDAVVIAEQGAQGDLLRHMIHMISERVFWTQRYVGELVDGFPQPDQDDAWHHYNDSVVAWNENYLLNTILAEKYFSTTTQSTLMDLNWMLIHVNDCVNKIHYVETYKAKDPICHFEDSSATSQQDNIRALQVKLKQVATKIGNLVDQLAK
jgi:hypothetical protein